MRSVHVWNRLQAEGLEPCGVIISIHSPEGITNFPANLREGWQGRLTLCFEDAEPGEPDSPRVFADHHAQAILEFCNRHKDIEEWHIHCDAGFSRSVAVGIMLADMFRRELTLHAVGTTEHANNWVMTVIKRLQWQAHFNDAEFWEIAKRKTLKE
jgi:predicted protein tyrosine phosphatase